MKGIHVCFIVPTLFIRNHFAFLVNHKHLVIPICSNDLWTGRRDYETKKNILMLGSFRDSRRSEPLLNTNVQINTFCM